MKLKPNSFLCIVTLMLFSVPAPAQLTIDATGTHKEPRDVAGSRVGGNGRKLLLQVAVEVHGGPSGDNGKTVVDFVLTNSGKEGLRIPISPDPGGVEPAETDHSYKLLSLYIASCGSPSEWPCAIARRRAILPGGARLYGNEESATLLTLAPGESIRVRAEVALPPASGAGQKSTAVFVAHAMLTDETVTTVDGKSFLDSKMVGAAKSPEYTLDGLYSSRK